MAFIAALFYRVGVVVFWLCAAGAGFLFWIYLTQPPTPSTPLVAFAPWAGSALFIFGVIVRYVFSAGRSTGQPETYAHLQGFVEKFGNTNTPVRMPVGPSNTPERALDQDNKSEPKGTWNDVIGIAGFVVLIVVVAFGKVIGQAAYALFATPSPAVLATPSPVVLATPPGEDRWQQIEGEWQRLETQLRKELPKKIDAMTTLKTVTHTGLTFVYNYQVDVTTATTGPIDYPAIDMVSIRNNLCHSASIRKMLKDGATVRSTYVDKKARPIGMLDVNEPACP